MDWKSRYAAKLESPEVALARIANGATVFIGSGCGEPQKLTRTLADMARRFNDLRVIRLTPRRANRPALPHLPDHIRFCTFHTGSGSHTAGAADTTPIHLSELPAAMARGIVSVDVALVQVSPPDSAGRMSLGIAVDAARAAVENARLVVAQVNTNMPITAGDAFIDAEGVHVLVDGTEPLLEAAPAELDPVTLAIGHLTANLITDGMTLHFDAGPIGAAALRCLDTKRDLGLHTDVLTDDHLRLITAGVITNRLKGVDRGRSVATLVEGSRDLYAAVDRNPHIEVRPLDYVADPLVIARNPNMTTVPAVDEMELTGLGRRDGETAGGLHAMPDAHDFIQGTRRSEKGIVVMALPSASADGLHSRITARCRDSGIFFDRAAVDVVVTEWGSVFIHGLTLRERAVALISIAHPSFRRRLLEEAQEAGYVDRGQDLPPEAGWIYPHRYELRRRFKGDLELFLRPVKPFDVRRLQELFYSLSELSIRMRYHAPRTTMTEQAARCDAHVDYARDMAIIGMIERRGCRRIVAEGRYYHDPETNRGEFGFLVQDEYRGRGIGTFLADYLRRIAWARGLSGIQASVIEGNRAPMVAFDNAWPGARKRRESDGKMWVLQFPPEDREAPRDGVILYSGRADAFSGRSEHPFRVNRARAALRLLERTGGLAQPWLRVEEPDLVATERLAASHDPAYLAALERMSAGGRDADFEAFGLGQSHTPLLTGILPYLRYCASASLTAADRLCRNEVRVAFNPLGGFHSAGRARAARYCYVNDVIAAVDTLLDHGLRVACIDLDAHHGEGLQQAYLADGRVLVASIHEAGADPADPEAAAALAQLTGRDAGANLNLNLPLPAGADDRDFGEAVSRVVNQALVRFAPDIAVIVTGADAVAVDPFAHLEVTNNALAAAVAAVRDHVPRLLLLGGGGHDVEATARAWCRMWIAANRLDDLPEHLKTVRGGGEERFAELCDPPPDTAADHPDRESIRAEVERTIRFHETETLPRIGPCR